MSTEQYPPKEWLPGNISLKSLDIHKPIPDELRGVYDLVHVRLLVAVLRDGDLIPVVENLFAMLSLYCVLCCLLTWVCEDTLTSVEPGGYLQWSEINPSTFGIQSIHPDTRTDELRYLVESFRLRAPLRWVSELPSFFAGQGLKDVLHRSYATPPELLMQMTQIHFMLGEEMSFVIMDNSDPAKGGPAYRRRIEEAAIEAKEGAAITFACEVTIGMRQVT